MSQCQSSCGCSSPATPQPSTSSVGGNKAVFHIENMDCPTEEALIRKRLATVEGMAGLDFNLIQRKLSVSHNLDSLETIQSALVSVGMKAVLEEGSPTKSSRHQQPAKTNWWPLAIAGVTAALAELIEF